MRIQSLDFQKPSDDARSRLYDPTLVCFVCLYRDHLCSGYRVGYFIATAVLIVVYSCRRGLVGSVFAY